MIHSLVHRLLLTLILAAPASVALAQSSSDDSDLFPEDERVLRLGNSERNITLSPFIQLDAGFVSVDEEGGAGGFDDGFVTDTRLVRPYVFFAYDSFGGTFAYDIEAEDYRYVFLTYEVDDTLEVKLGQQDEPFSLQDLSGSRFLPFAEAGQSAALNAGDNVGLAAFYKGDQRSLAGGVFGGNLNDGVGDSGLGFAGRATWAPIYEEDRITRGGDAAKSGVGTSRVKNLLHLGLGLSARFDVDDSLSFSGDASSSLPGSTLASSPTFRDTDSLVRGNLEISRSIGSFSTQAELTGAHVEADNATGFAHGGYLYATYFLTGERRGYDASAGTFGRVVPKNPVDDGGFGAYEVGARVDYLDLTDTGADGGAQAGVSLAGNAYLTKRLLLTADYSYTRVYDGPIEDTEVHALTFRFQFAY